MTAIPLDVLKTVFGFDSFRGQQAEIIEHVCGGGDALVLMPTGGGKSLCYQVPALVRPGTGIVVSPLIALMQDQVDSMRQLGVRAAALNSSLSWPETQRVLRELRAGELDLLYVAPERLLTDALLDQLDDAPLALFAIDEAHCVSQWGHDFRPEYLQLALVHERYPAVPRIALTATADGPTRREIVERLKLGDGRVFVASFDRPNIRYRVQPKSDGRRQLLAFLGNHAGQAGIVYCMSRNKVDETAQWLVGQGFPALPYHAGLDKAVRAGNQDRFLKEDGLVMVATIAFGMGIDKPDVRFVVHLDLPKSLEAYYQETGRAGRDGLPSETLLVYGLQDVARIRQLVDDSEAGEQQKRIERRKLDALLGFCETTRCRRQTLLEYFGEAPPQPCGNCDTCLEPVESWDATEVARKALSCVYRTGQRFGAVHVIDVLTGKDGERIRQLGHDRLSTWGIGKELAATEWQSVFRQLAASGLLVRDMEHGGLRLGPDCRAVLRGEAEVRLRRDAPAKATRTARTGRAREAMTFDLPDDEALFQRLRAARLALAREQGLAPYVIFHDSTLVEMVRRRPRARHELARLPGVGEAKLERYGSQFLAVIAAHHGDD